MIHLELRRQLFHLFLGVFLGILVFLDMFYVPFFILLLIVGVFLSLVSRKRKLPILNWFLEKFERKEMMKKMPGKCLLTFLIGVTITVFIFEKNIAIASILILAIGDSTSHIIGSSLGKIKNTLNPKKKIEGTLAGIFFSTIGSQFFSPLLNVFLASIIAMFIEMFEIRIGKFNLDDNISIPIVSGLVLQILSFL